MKERPILFSAPMVRAILAGTKTQTRRVVKPQPAGPWAAPGKTACPYGLPGDRLWVKETIRKTGEYPGGYSTSEYVADGTPTVADAWPWQRRTLVSIHCPRGLSRITLEVTGVRVERLQDISHADADAEGCRGRRSADPALGFTITPRERFNALWEQINGAASWAANPWVWVVEFKRVQP